MVPMTVDIEQMKPMPQHGCGRFSDGHGDGQLKGDATQRAAIRSSRSCTNDRLHSICFRISVDAIRGSSNHHFRTRAWPSYFARNDCNLRAKPRRGRSHRIGPLPQKVILLIFVNSMNSLKNMTYWPTYPDL
jgi:hypothetical protein